jgi:hypothetical protein
MHARAVNEAGARLRELRREEWEDLALAVLVLGLALAATQAVPSLALPLFVGALFVGVLGIRALWRHWDLVDRLADEPDAYRLTEVRTYASRETTMDRRRWFAVCVRELDDTDPELAALAAELEDARLELRPECAVLCSRLVGDPARSASLQRDRATLRSTVARIRSGFAPRRDAAA